VKKYFISLIIGMSIILITSSCKSSQTREESTSPPATTTNALTENPTKTPTIPPTATPTPEPTPTVTPIFVDTETLNSLKNINVPINDPNELAKRFLGVEEIPEITPPKEPFQVGDKQDFYVTDYQDKNYKLTATLHYVTDHAYFWVDDNAQFEIADLEKLAKTFEKKIYPTDRRFFGSEWTPGIDGDQHIYILFARRLGFYIAGYFSSADEINPAVRETSNGHEMFVMNIDNVELADPFTYGVLAHEFQHMIHWNLDQNETTWLNEGFSELAQFLNGYPAGDNDKQYTGDPDLQLNTWSGDEDENFRHYGASFLFTTYFLDRFGKEATQALVAHPENGLESIDLVLKEMNIIDETTNQPLTADDIILDWSIANFLNDVNLDDGHYAYKNYSSPPKTKQTDVIRNCEPGPYEFDVHQYGVDYIRFLCPGQYTLNFEGAVKTNLVPVDAYSGDYFFWSNEGDSSDMTLTHEFDFTNVNAPLTLTYWTWYDIEKGYDYAYLETSLDGIHWEILKTPNGTDRNPSGNSYGWGYTNKTRGNVWIQESVDISELAGNDVLLRFEYITDAALHGDGLLLDDIAIPEINYFTDFEEDDGGWEASGFVRVNNILPQTFRLALISQGGETVVEIIPLGVNNLASIALDIPEKGKSVVLAVIGTTRFTNELAKYKITLDIP